MKHSAPFRLNRNGLLLALVSAAFAGEAGAAAGRVDFTVGSASVVGTDGLARPLAKGTELDTGDTVRTTDGRVQLRMTDGGYISLQPNTEFGIKNYKFDGKTDGSESAVFSLVKGAMRTVTGLIGRVNRNRYQVGTPTATVGIRGTGGLIQILQDGSTLVQGTSGIWFLANPSGSIDIPAGVSGLAPADPKQPPKETTVVPVSGPAPLQPKPEEYVQGDQRTSTGEPVLVPESVTPLQSGSGYAVVAAYSFFSSPYMENSSNASAVFNASGQMTSATISSGTWSLGGGSHADFGTDGILAWGRWIGTISSSNFCEGACTDTLTANQGWHYVVGMPTVSMPQTGSATYSMAGATQPTYVDGTFAPGTVSGNLNVNFGTNSVGVNLNVGMPDGKGYAIGGSAQISGSMFSGTTGASLSAFGTGGACTSSCGATVNGFFAGATAERAGLGYHIQDFTSGKNVVGAAAFKK